MQEFVVFYYNICWVLVTFGLLSVHIPVSYHSITTAMFMGIFVSNNVYKLYVLVELFLENIFGGFLFSHNYDSIYMAELIIYHSANAISAITIKIIITSSIMINF